MSETVLRVEDLRTHFFTRSGVVKAVDGVSFSVGRGETLGIVGESGSGKSVTALSILRMVAAPAGKIVGGRILLRGDDLLEKSEKEMVKIRGARISMILQDPMTSLDPLFTIGDQLAEPVRIHQRNSTVSVQARVEEMLRLVRIPAPEQRVHDYPHQMSGGMRQRIVGAIALACQPELLIADEPTTSLDVTIQLQFLALLKDVQRQLDLAMIIITHDFGIVARICHRVAVMYAGRIVEAADVRALFRNPAHPYTVALLKSLPRLGAEADRLFTIGGQPPDLRHHPPGCSFAPRCIRAMDICSREYPPQRDVGEHHLVSCHLTGKSEG
ncbi:MAG TPA: ABC transporter ATP-binding protein [Candidatus Methylomirabilis sp.]|nr:ABC transporter ATP-binding protein [Candidatus Methylomirabilis sp.]